MKKILLRSAFPGMIGGYIATIEGMSGSHQGNTMGEAVGNLVLAHSEILGIETAFAPPEKKAPIQKD